MRIEYKLEIYECCTKGIFLVLVSYILDIEIIICWCNNFVILYYNGYLNVNKEIYFVENRNKMVNYLIKQKKIYFLKNLIWLKISLVI